MKTPRDILFERHRAAEPKLDAIRQEVVAQLSATPTRTPPDICLGDSIRRFLFSFRWHLAGMSAAWLMVVILNMDHSANATARIATENIPSPRQILTALQKNRRELLQFTESPVAAPAALPARRSEFQSSSAMA